MQRFADRLSELRKARALTQKQVARETGIPLRTYVAYEQGERRARLTAAVELARFFEVSLDYLAGLTETQRGTE